MEGRWRIWELESMTEEHSCATFISVACACSSAVLVCACRVVRGVDAHLRAYQESQLPSQAVFIHMSTLGDC